MRTPRTAHRCATCTHPCAMSSTNGSSSHTRGCTPCPFARLPTAPLNQPRNRSARAPTPPPCPCVPLQSLMGDANDTVRRLASFGVGASLAFLEPEVQSGILKNLVRGRAPSGGAGGAGAGAGASGDWTVVHGVRLALYGAVRCVPSPLPVVHGLVCVWIAGPLALFTPRGPSLLLFACLLLSLCAHDCLLHFQVLALRDGAPSGCCC